MTELAEAPHQILTESCEGILIDSGVISLFVSPIPYHKLGTSDFHHRCAQSIDLGNKYLG